MTEFFTQNGGTIAVFIIVAGIIGCAVRKLVKDRKSGKTSCGCGCSKCSKNSCSGD